MYAWYLVKIKHNISYFYNAVLTTPAASSMVWNIKFIKYRENKLIVTKYVENVCLWLKHKLASVLAIGELYHQSTTAPRCTTQLRAMRGLSLLLRRSSKLVSCIFLTIFYSCSFPILIRKLPNQSLSTVAFDSDKFKSKLCLLHHQLEIFTNYILKFTWQWVTW